MAPFRSEGNVSLVSLKHPASSAPQALLDWYAVNESASSFSSGGTITPTEFSTPAALDALDVTQDGIDDIVVLSEAGSLHVVPASSDNFTFGSTYTGASVSCGGNCSHLVSGFVTTDDAVDFVVVDPAPAMVHVLINTADSTHTFTESAAVQFPEAIHELHVFLADFDKDGDADLFALGIETGSVYYAENRDPATGASWSTPTILVDGVSPHVLTIGDANGDGVSDVIVMTLLLKQTSYYAGVGNGTVSTTPVGMTSPFEHVSVVAMGDVDGDGRADILVLVPWNETVLVKVSSREDGTWDTGSHFATITKTEYFDGIRLVDVNNDSLPDVLVGEDGGDYVLLMNPYGEPLAEGEEAGAEYVLPVTHDASDADFAMCEIVHTPFTATSYGWELACPENKVMQRYKLSAALPTRAPMSAASLINVNEYWEEELIDVADLNGDGVGDIVFSDFESILFGYMLADVNGLSPGGATVLLNESATACERELLPPVVHVRAGDIDGDGDVDVALAYECGSSHYTAWYENVASGDATVEFTPEPHRVLTADGGTHDDSAHFQLVDLDGDTDLDIVTMSAKHMLVFENCGSERGPDRFASPVHLLWDAGTVTGFRKETVAITDVTGDGIDDVLFEHHSVQVYLLTGSTPTEESLEELVFAEPILLSVDAPSIPFAEYSLLLDVDGDGTDDLVVGGYDAAVVVYWYRGTGEPGRFASEAQHIGSFAGWGGGLGRMELVDLDTDGDLDLVLYDGMMGGSSIYAIENLGDSTFGEPTRVLSHGYSSPSFGDINEDGALDLIFYEHSSVPRSHDVIYMVQMLPDEPFATMADAVLVAEVKALSRVMLADVGGADAKPEVVFASNNFTGGDEGGVGYLPNVAGVLQDELSAVTVWAGASSADQVYDVAVAHAKGIFILGDIAPNITVQYVVSADNGATFEDPEGFSTSQVWPDSMLHLMHGDGGAMSGVFVENPNQAERVYKIELADDWVNTLVWETRQPQGPLHFGSNSTLVGTFRGDGWSPDHIFVCSLGEYCAPEPATRHQAGYRRDEYPEATLQIVDVDNDGRKDIVTAGARSSSVTQYTLVSDMEFSVETVFHDLDIVGAQLIDVDNQGAYELVYVTMGETDTLVHVASLDNETGRYDTTQATATELQSVLSPNGMVFAQLDDDDYVDYAAGQYGSTIQLNDGSGAFPSATEVGWKDVFALSVVDFDGDGDTDVVYVDEGGLGFIEQTQEDGSPVFQPPSDMADDPVGFRSYYSKLIVADMNNDGADDIVILAEENSLEPEGTVVMIAWNPNATHGAWTTTMVHQYVAAIRDIAVHDVDGNGYADIVLATAGKEYDVDDPDVAALPLWSRLLLLRNRGGSFGCADIVATGVPVHAVAVADIDGAGFPEIVTMDDRGDVRVHPVNAAPASTTTTTTSTTAVMPNATTTAAADGTSMTSTEAPESPAEPGPSQGSSAVGEEEGLDGGAIAGIVTGVLVGVALLAAAAIVVSRRAGGDGAPTTEAEAAGAAEMGALDAEAKAATAASEGDVAAEVKEA